MLKTCLVYSQVSYFHSVESNSRPLKIVLYNLAKEDRYSLDYRYYRVTTSTKPCTAHKTIFGGRGGVEAPSVVFYCLLQRVIYIAPATLVALFKTPQRVYRSRTCLYKFGRGSGSRTRVIWLMRPSWNHLQSIPHYWSVISGSNRSPQLGRLTCRQQHL